jgi:hypothetical protein
MTPVEGKFLAIGSHELCPKNSAIRLGAPIQYDAPVFNLPHNDRLCRSWHVRLRRTDCEIRKQSRRLIRVNAIDVSAQQVAGVVVLGEEHMVGSDMPDREEAISSVQNCPTANLKAVVSWSAGSER